MKTIKRFLNSVVDEVFVWSIILGWSLLLAVGILAVTIIRVFTFVPDRYSKWKHTRRIVVYGKPGKGSSKSIHHIDPADLVPLDMYSKLSPEDTIKWAQLKHEAMQHLRDHRQEIDEAEERMRRKRWKKYQQDEKEKKPKKGTLLLGPASKALRPSTPSETDGEGRPSEHTDEGSELRSV